MEKLFKYSKVVAYVYAFIFAIFLLMELSPFFGFHIEPILLSLDCYFAFMPYDVYQIFFVFLGKIAVLLWFVLIVKLSVKKSPLIVPSIIGIVSQLLGIAQFVYVFPGFSRISSILYVILNIITFIWLSSYFEKKSKLQIMSICLAFTPILAMRYLVFTINSLFGVIGELVLFIGLPQILYIFFFMGFSKINKK